MRQSFEPKGGPDFGRKNLPLLRRVMKDLRLDGLYVPHDDEYQNEYLPACYERLEWVSGFTGSAGAAFVFMDSAVLFADGRYTLQAKEQTDNELYAREDLMSPGPFGWLAAQEKSGCRIGFDPKLVSPDGLTKLQAAAIHAGAELVKLENNPIDMAWENAPTPPSAKIVPHGLDYSGEDSTSKRHRLAEGLKSRGADAAILTAPHSLAWLFNIRGGDVDYSPLPLGRAILNNDGSARLYTDLHKTDGELIAHLGNEVELSSIDNLEEGISALKDKTVSLDPALASSWFFDRAEASGARILREDDPCALPRACKNATEVEGARKAHIRDGVAIVKFLHWLSTEGQSGHEDEISAAMKLEALREETGALKDLSFDTISGAGPNGAIVHYRVSTQTCRKLEKGSLYLVDSGGQYLDGTTDITRTVAIGTPNDEMRERYTDVLRGHIFLSKIRFPDGVNGSQLDVLARAALWQKGLDYAHGTGHGVGSYLGVHEGPQRISPAPNSVALQTGMIVSNEPGYYKTGSYGIRIENLQVVTAPENIEGGDQPMRGFETLTIAPLEPSLIVKELLTTDEVEWLNDYHEVVFNTHKASITGDVLEWLREVTAPV